MQLEFLEHRQLLAVGPRLVDIESNFGDSIDNGDTLRQSPRELTLSFANNDSINGASARQGGVALIGSGGDNSFGEPNDVVFDPAFVGLGAADNEVLIRFAETLPDDRYQLLIRGSGTPLTNIGGEPFNNGVDEAREFQLEKGARVLSIVPQPVTRHPTTGQLTQARDQIHVYFDDDMNVASAEDPAFYRLEDKSTGDIHLPSTASYDAGERMVALTFASDLPAANFHLQIGEHKEANSSLGTATNIGTITQQSPFRTYETEILLDTNGDPITTPIDDLSTVISTISVDEDFLLRDVEVQVDIDHEAGEDLQIFLISPSGRRVELVSDLGSDELQGQIYGTKFHDLDGDGVQDTDEPGLAGWTIFLDTNDNAVLDSFERSTVTDSEGNYSFVGLTRGFTYQVAEVPQNFWSQTSVTTGGEQTIFEADFSDGSLQFLDIIPDMVDGLADDGAVVLLLNGNTAVADFTGIDQQTADNIQFELQQILEPGQTVDVTVSGSVANRFEIRFTRTGINTPYDSPILQAFNGLNRGNVELNTVARNDGFFTPGPPPNTFSPDEWHLTKARDNDAGHSGEDSFYFGIDPVPPATVGQYGNNALGSLFSPEIDLTGPTLVGDIDLRFSHFLNSESGFDFASVYVNTSDGERVQVFNQAGDNGGWVTETISLNNFRGQLITLEFEFDTDGSVIDEGWFVDDIEVVTTRGIASVPIGTAPQTGFEKNLELGSNLPLIGEPNEFGYRASTITPEFENIASTGNRILQEFVGNGFALDIGGTASEQANAVARDAAGNIYLTGVFQGTVDFDPSAGGTFELTSAGINDIFVAKYAADGTFINAVSFGDAGVEDGQNLTVDASGNVYLTGSFSGTVNFGGTSLTSNGNSDLFVAKLDTDLNVQWAASAGSATADAGRGITLDNSGNVLVTGEFTGTTSFGTTSLTSAGSSDAFVWILDNDGNHDSAFRIGNTGSDRGREIAVDSAGNVTIAGRFSGTVDFNLAPGAANVDALTSGGSTDGFVVQYAPDGTFRWADRFGSGVQDEAKAVTIDSDDNVIVTGSDNSDIIVRKYDQDGAEQWTRTFGAGSTDSGEDVDVDSLGRVYVTGSFRQSFSGIISNGGTDIFLLRLTAAGATDVLVSMGGNQDDAGLGVVTDGNGNFIHTGSFRSTVDFDLGPVTDSLTAVGSQDAYLATYNTIRGIDDGTHFISSADLTDAMTGDVFEFSYFEQVYGDLFVSTNGLVTFVNPNPTPDNGDLTSAPTEASILPFWEDLFTDSAPDQAVFWEVRGEGDRQRLIIQWNNVQLDGIAGVDDPPLTFQMVLREIDGSIHFNYQSVTDTQFIQGAEQTVGTFEFGSQQDPAIASDAAGNTLVVWESPGQSGTSSIYGRILDASGNPIATPGNPSGDEFLISPAGSDDTSPAVAMNDAGQAVVAWYDNNGPRQIFLQRFAADGSFVGTPIKVNTLDGMGSFPAVELAIDDIGNFIVAWGNTPAEDDGEAVLFRRFDFAGNPIDARDEIQTIEFLGPPASPRNFTLFFGGQPTTNISYAGPGNGLLTAANIQSRLRVLPNLSDDVTVTPIAINEVQTIRLTGTPTMGDFTLSFQGTPILNPILFDADPNVMRAAIEMELRDLANIDDALTVTLGGPGEFVVNFAGVDGNQDLPLLQVTANTLDPATTIEIEETVKGSNPDERFRVEFLGADGQQDQPLITLGDFSNGVTHLVVDEVQTGTSGEVRANTTIPPVQVGAGLALQPSGEFTVSWASEDGPEYDLYAKNFDANAEASPADRNEIQEYRLNGSPSVGSRYRLRHEGQTTGDIFYTGNNVIDIADITAAFAGIGRNVVVDAVPGNSNEIQRIVFLGTPDSGTFRLAHAGQITAPITYAGTSAANGITTANNIAAALNALGNVPGGVSVVPTVTDSAVDFLVTFGGAVGGVDQPLMVFFQNNLNTGTATISEINQGGRDNFQYRVEFVGDDGNQDLGDITLADNTGGVVSINQVTIQDGNNAEYLIPQNTLGVQEFHHLTPNPNPAGGYLAVWESRDGDGAGIFGRLIDPSGAPLNAEFQINTITGGNQRRPQATFLANGDFLITWRGPSLDPTQGIDVYGRRFSSSGIALGDDFVVNQVTFGNQIHPHVTPLPGGGYAVAFQSGAGGGGVHLQYFDNNDNPVGAEQTISQFGLPSQTDVDVARNAIGQTVVVWTEQQRDTDLSTGIYAQTFDATGTPISGEFLVAEVSELDQTDPQVGIDDFGNLVVVWRTTLVVPDPDNPGSDKTIFHLRGRRFDIFGSDLSGGEFAPVNPSDSSVEPLLSVAGDGRFVIGFEPINGVTDWTYEAFDAAGNSFGSTTVARPEWNGIEQSDIAFAPSGSFFVIAWRTSVEDPDGVLSNNAYIQIFEPDGTPRTQPFFVHEDEAGEQLEPKVGIDGADNITVAWQDQNLGAVLVRRFDSTGTPTSDSIEAITPIVDHGLSVSRDGSASLVWDDPNTGDLFVQRLTDTGLLMGFPEQVNAGGSPDLPEIAADGSGEFTVAWIDNGRQVRMTSYTSDFPSVGIRDAETERPGGDPLPIWVDGSRTPFVGSSISTRISLLPEVTNSFFAISNAGDEILELDADSGATINSIPTPVTTPGSGALAQLGDALYFLADGDTTLYQLASSDGAWTDTIDLAALGLSNQIDALAVLNGQIVLQDIGNGLLTFLDPFKGEVTGSITPGTSIKGGLAGGGDRGTLFGVNAAGDIVEINAEDGSIESTLNVTGDPVLGLGFVQGALVLARGSNMVSRIDPDSGMSLGDWTIASPVTSVGGDGEGGIETAFDPILEGLPGTLLDDDASRRITSGEGPYVGSFRPTEPLAGFDGEQSLGDWDLEIRDTLAEDEGVLHQWRLILNQPEDTPADYTTQAFIGDEIGAGANDVDLYRVEFLDPGTVDIQVDPDPALDVTVRLFDALGNELGRASAANAGQLERLVRSTATAGVYYVGVSSQANNDYDPNNASTSTGGTSTGRYKLEIRFDQTLEIDDDDSSYSTANNIGVLGEAGFQRAGEIDSPAFTLRLPGGIDDPGHRDIPFESHINQGPQSTIRTAPYNFADDYGSLPSGDRAINAITDAQKDRAREIFEIYGEFLGVQFYETASQGLQVVTGDLRAVNPGLPPGPDGPGGVASGGLGGRVVMNAALDYGTSPFGGGWFTTAMHEIGHALGLGHTYEQPAITVMGDRPQDRFNDRGEPIFPGPVDVIHARHIRAPLSRDIDLFRFEIIETGTLTAETFAERFSSGVSLLNTELSLYRESTLGGRVTRELIASNDDYFGDDSRIQLHVEPGVYYLGVHSSGLEEIDPRISDSGFGGISDGRYEVQLDFVADARSSLRDASGGIADGDSDGAPGGVFDFWFQSGPTIFVDKLNDTSSAADGDGSLADPFDNIPSALAEARTRIVVPSLGASAINDGDTFSVLAADGSSETFQFEIGAATGIPNRITIAEDASAAEVALAIADALNDPDVGWNVTATASGAIVELDGIARRDISGTPGLIKSSNLIRIVGNGGLDGNINSVGDNESYLIGLNNSGASLEDGMSLDVPQGVTVVVDEGAIFKLQDANVDVGTSSQGIDRSGGALQLLGTPGAPVLFRSYRNDAVGGDDNGPDVAPQPGDWGGIVIRNDADLEQDGIFLNHINLADINNGGGRVTVDSVEQSFTPVHIIGARPTVSNLVIRGSAAAAVSADPNSFEESLGRIGPDVHNNLIVDNSINGLFIRIRTSLGQVIDRLDVAARMDDTDIVHVLTESLIVAGNPGGPIELNGQLVARSGARLAIDPGIVVKLESARIEVEVGGRMIAEGVQGSEIVFTALKDDSFGAGGTSDTTSDDDSTSPVPGQWGGLYFAHSSKASLDHARIQYAGGETAIEGDFDNFNPIEIHQAEVRITNSDLSNNAAGTATSSRNGRGRNDAAVIFVRGAQPIIVNNRIFDNVDSQAITIDVNSLQEVRQPDYGQQTGYRDTFSEFADNHGPLVRLNRLQNNRLNGMEVRGGVLKTEGVWDDPDIVHVVRDEIVIPNFHSLGGLRLQSSDAGSLVVKLSGNTAGFTASGDPLDISDRIGGSLYVIGATNRPVIFTSLRDDTVAAGFDLSGMPVFDTGNDGETSGQPGDWRSIRLDRYSNDRNVTIDLEDEANRIGTSDANGTPTTAEFLGTLAVNDKNGDDDRRVGFTVLGSISVDNPNDVDVYSFTGIPGTEVWIDVDRTDFSLDVVVELIDSSGAVLASALDNSTLAGLALPLTKDSALGGDLYTSNPRDAGMRVVLPPSVEPAPTYYVRVRSAVPGEQDPMVVEERSRGNYQLQVRLRQIDEVPGSTIRNSEITFATNGIEVLGLPAHSPLTGESAEAAAGNDTFGSAQPLGNLLVSERNTISVGGSIVTPAGLPAGSDIDWYRFELDVDQIQSIGGVNDGGKTWSTVFDIDYADGLARPDLVLAVFDENGVPILISRDSNVEDDRGTTGQNNGTSDLTRGSVGSLDPFIGSVQMPTGVIPAQVSRTYYVAVATNAQLPTALTGTFTSNSGSSLVRLEPVTSVQRIAEDHIGFSGHTTGDIDEGIAFVNPVQTLFDIEAESTLSTNVVELTLNEMVLYVGGPSGLTMVNPFTGEVIDRVGNLNGQTSDLAMRTDGRLFAMRSLNQGNPPNNAAGALVGIDPTTSAENVIGNDGIVDFDPNTNPPNLQQLTSNNVEALAYLRTGFNNNANTPNYNLYYAVRGHRPSANSTSTQGATLYRANPANGSAAVAQNQPWGRIGTISTSITPTGMAFIGTQLYGVDDAGNLFTISTSTGAANVVANLGVDFEGLSAGPRHLQDGAFADLLFGVTSGGTLLAFDTSGNLQGVFNGGSSSISTGVPGTSTGLAFSPLDFNLWHPTLQRRADDGHGINPSFDLSRENPSDFERPFDTDEAEGGVSFYFGFEDYSTTQQDFDNGYLTYGQNSQFGVSSDAHRDLASNPLFNNNYNLPGGAIGSLATNAFSLAGYDSADKPTIYFNYFLATENANSGDTGMRDSFRVQISSDGGFSWNALATNNSVLDEELPEFLSTSENESFDTRQRVQELFDNTDGWRQARIDLSEFAGSASLQVRFDFSTAGTMNQAIFTPGDEYGDASDVSRAEDNNFEGVYIDDVIIGFAERGEMITNTTPTSQTGFTPLVRPDDAPQQVLAGSYQLEIRRGTEYATTVTEDASETLVFTQFDTNDRMITGEGITRFGDQNTRREVGQISIERNAISHSSNFGILVDAGARDAAGNLPHPASVRNLPTVNSQRLVPGITIENNVIAELGAGGILFSGDPNAGAVPDAAVTFGRILNNTIYGDEQATGTGIRVTENSSPTLLNNIVANTATAISIDGSSSSTIVGTTLLQGNTQPGNFSDPDLISLTLADPLFVDAAGGNFYLADGSEAIDSSRNTLQDRPSIVQVKSPLGISPSPITAPDRDLFNQLRIDDPSQDPPPGLGANVFIDRGAVERADFVGPTVVLITPEDNDAAGIDLDATRTVVQLSSGVLNSFEILFADDPGIGPDPATITADQITLTENGQLLTGDLDYFVFFNVNNGILTLTPDAGEWASDSVFVITLDNQVIADLAGNNLQANRPNGTTAFTIVMPDVQLDFGDAPNSYGTLATANGPRHAVNATGTPRLGLLVDRELNGQPIDGDDANGVDDEDGLPTGSFVGMATTGGLILDDGTLGQTSDPADVIGFLNRGDAAGTLFPLTVTGSGLLDLWIDFNRDGDFNELNERVATSLPVADGLNQIRVFTPSNAATGLTYARLRISTEGIATSGGIANDGEVEDHPLGIFDIVQPDVVDDDFYVVAEDEVLTVDGNNFAGLLANDVLPTEEFIQPQFVIDAPRIPHPTDLLYRTTHGQVRIDDAAAGLFTYTPDPDYYGPDSFRYAVSTQRNAGPEFDATADFATATINVSPVNDAPGVADQNLRTIEDVQEEDLVNGGFLIPAANLLAGATPIVDGMATTPPQDESNQEVFLRSISTVVGGVTTTLDATNSGDVLTTIRGGLLTAAFDVDGNITSVLYRPAQDFNSENLPAMVGDFLDDEFIFTVVDDGISLPVPPTAPPPPIMPMSASATAFIRVTPQNDPPVLAADDVSITDTAGDYLAYYAGLNLTAPVPTEEQSLTILSGFLLRNDEEARSSAADEQTQFNGNDGPLRVVDAALVDPALGQSISVDPVTGDITFVPADDIFGEVLFTYTVEDQGIDQAAMLDPMGNPAPKLAAPLRTTIMSRIFLEPVNDIPVAVDRMFDVTEAIETRPPDAPVTPAEIEITPSSLLAGSTADLLNPSVDATASDILLAAPYNEDNQTLRVNSITVEGVTTSTTGTLTTASGGELSVEFDANGFLTRAVYTPPVDFNSNSPFPAADTFTYTIADDGVHEFPVGNTLSPDTPPETSFPATVTLTVNPANDLPVFDVLTQVDILEDTPSTWIVNNFFSNVGGGPLATALDELGQSVTFTIAEFSANPSNLMVSDPDVSNGSSIEFFPAVDLFGSAVYVITGTDDGTPNQSISKTITVNVRPVNDAPRFDNGVAGSSDVEDPAVDPDSAYSVANLDFNNDGQVDDATITYTLREDNTQRFGNTSVPYFIPLSAGPAAAGYQQIGLLDVFNVGPDNEAAPLPGGSQTLELFSYGNAPQGGSGDFTTDLGGILRPVVSGGTLLGLEYIPPTDFNNIIGGFDSFTYQVRDDSTTGGETYSLNAAGLVPDRLTSTNRVFLNLNPVNDRPEFTVGTTYIEVPEDSTELKFANYAFNVSPGPQATAFDEFSFSTGQSVSFTLTPLDFSPANTAQFFTTPPQIDATTGELKFRAAPNAFGEFDFEIRLVDTGLGSVDGDNLRGDLNTSLPTTLTIDVQPTNDPPVVDPNSDPLDFTLLEDGSFEIPVTGTGMTAGLLDVFLVGPANEAADILPEPGGNQSLSLGSPVPRASAAGGSIQPVTDPTTGEVLSLIYRPRKDFVGMDSFIYTVVDDGVSVGIGTGGTPFADPRIASNRVTFDVLPVNDAPLFSGAPNVVSDEDDGVVMIDMWANNVQAGPTTALDELNGFGAIPPQSLEFVFTQLTGSAGLFATPPRAVINNGSATLTYESAANANGVATFEVFLRDDGPTDAGIGDVNVSAPTTFVINVRAVNDPPTFTAGAAVTVAEDSGPYSQPWATAISPGPADESSQSVQFVVTTPPEFTSLFLAQPTINDQGVLRFTPAQNANTDNPLGPAQIQVTAVDSAGGQAQTVVLPITIQEVNDPPMARPDQINTTEDAVLTIPSSQILANDLDPDLATNANEVLSVVMPAQSFSVAGARVTYNSATGEIVYDPSQATSLQSLTNGQSLVDSFSYRARDAAGATSGLVTVALNVTGINDAPTVVDDDVDLNQSGPTIIRPLDNDSDIDGTIDPTSIVITLQPAFGGISIRPDGTLEYTAFVAFSVEDQFRYTVTDLQGARSQEATVTVSANASPIAVNDSKGTFLDEAVDIDVAANDVDPDGILDLNSVVIVTPPTRGEAVVTSGGIVQYLPDPGFVGRDSFTYQISDTEGRSSNVATVSTRVVASRLQNPDIRTDVNGDGFTTALDALLVINRLARADGAASIPVLPTDRGPNFFDVNGNQSITAADAIIVINEISRLNAGSAFQAEQVTQGPIDRADQTGTDLASSNVVVEEPSVVADALNIVDTGGPSAGTIGDDLIDLIAEDREEERDEDEAVAALDAAMADLL